MRHGSDNHVAWSRIGEQAPEQVSLHLQEKLVLVSMDTSTLVSSSKNPLSLCGSSQVSKCAMDLDMCAELGCVHLPAE